MGIIQALDKELFKEYSLAVSKGGLLPVRKKIISFFMLVSSYNISLRPPLLQFRNFSEASFWQNQMKQKKL
jgi:hypothetical protein